MTASQAGLARCSRAQSACENRLTASRNSSSAGVCLSGRGAGVNWKTTNRERRHPDDCRPPGERASKNLGRQGHTIQTNASSTIEEKGDTLPLLYFQIMSHPNPYAGHTEVSTAQNSQTQRHHRHHILWAVLTSSSKKPEEFYTFIVSTYSITSMHHCMPLPPNNNDSFNSLTLTHGAAEGGNFVPCTVCTCILY